MRLGAQHLVAGAAAAAFVTWYGATKHWVANNVLGVAFSVQGIQHVSLGNYKIGALLLVRSQQGLSAAPGLTADRRPPHAGGPVRVRRVLGVWNGRHGDCRQEL